MRRLTLSAAILLAFQANADSLDGTTITAQGGGSLLTADGTWTFGSQTGPSGNQILLNGSANNGGMAWMMEVVNGKLYANTLDAGWWIWSSTNGWNQTTAPVITGAYPVTITWTPPTKNNDNTPYTNPKGYTIYWASESTKYTDINKFTLNTPAASQAVFMFPAGKFYFSMSAVNAADVPSLLSNEASTTTAPKPLPLSITASQDVQLHTSMTTVYSDQKQADTKALRAVGTIAVGELCIPTEALLTGGATYYGVPTAKVTWVGSVKPLIVYGICQ